MQPRHPCKQLFYSCNPKGQTQFPLPLSVRNCSALSGSLSINMIMIEQLCKGSAVKNEYSLLYSVCITVHLHKWFLSNTNKPHILIVVELLGITLLLVLLQLIIMICNMCIVLLLIPKGWYFKNSYCFTIQCIGTVLVIDIRYFIYRFRLHFANI